MRISLHVALFWLRSGLLLEYFTPEVFLDTLVEIISFLGFNF